MSEQKQRVYDALNKLGIKYEVVEHEPVHNGRHGPPRSSRERNSVQEPVSQRCKRKTSFSHYL